MKKINIALAAVAAMTVLSCNKEMTPSDLTPSGDTNLVQKTFYATYGEETKVAVDAVNTSSIGLKWESGDQIHVLTVDLALPSSAAEASNISGNSADFTAWTPAEATTYYAVYPASAVATTDTWVTNGEQKGLRVTIPAEQQAVHNSFDPKAYVATAVTTDDHLSFKPAISAIKFQLGDKAADVEKVVFQINESTNVAGTGVLYTNDFTSHTWLDNTTCVAYPEITLTKPVDGFQPSTDYYITFRANSCPKGITLYIAFKDGSVKKVSSSKQLFTSTVLGAVKSFGDIVAPAKTLSAKDAYDLGFDLIVAGKSYSPAALGTATLVSESTTISANGVYFIADGVDVQISNGPYSKLFVIGNSLESKTNITLYEQVRYSTSGVVGFKNLAFSQYSNDMFVHNNASSEATRFAFDNCNIITPTSNGVMYNATDRTLAEFAMHNCNIKVTKDSDVFIRTYANYSNIDLHNNIFYPAEGDKMDFYLINNSSIVVTDLTLTQNTFANVYNITSAGVQNPYISAGNVGSYTLKNNLFYLETYGSQNENKNPVSWILSCTPMTYEANNNILYKDINNKRLKIYKESTDYTSCTATKTDVVIGDVDLSVPTIVPATTAGATR
ncbi:MAG: fimbrillin family protein [Candidatus Cryptobacteroides sp.]